MAGNYGLADPGSVLQNVPDYGNAVAALNPPSGQSSGGGADPGPTGIVFVDGKGYRRRKGLDANGNVIYRDLTTDERRMNAGQYSWDREDAELSRRRTEEAQGRIAAIGERNHQAEIAQRNAENERGNRAIDAQIQSSNNSYSLGLAGIENQAAALNANTLSRDKDRAQQGDQFAASMAQQTRQMELNNDLLRQKLGVEDRHFQQQMALDERNARRTKVLGSLTLIAQSLQRL
jgi:hypothetical protein